MKHLGKATIGIALITLLVGCGSTPPSQHYLLTASGSGAMPVNKAPAIGVGPVVIPQYLNRDPLVRRDSSNRLLISATERWAEPLEDGILRVMGLNLADLLDTQNLRFFPWHPDYPPTYGVRLRIVRMDATADTATLIAEWFVYRLSDEAPVARQLSNTTVSLASSETDTNTLVGTYSELLLQLSKEIAKAIEVEVAREEADSAPAA